VLAGLEPLAMSSAGYGVVVLLGLLWGSFANVCIYRWPAGASVVSPGSHCFACQAPVRWYDNVPILSWLWLRGRCRACGAEFSARYLIVEATTAALFAVSWWAAVIAPQLFEPFGPRLLHFAIYAAFCFAMVVITFIDIDHKLILNKVTIPSMILAYAASFAWPAHHWYDGLLGAAIGYGLPWAIGEVYYRITGREGLGLGDGMLLAVVGALLGWHGVLVSLFGGSMIGSVIGITAVVLARMRGEAAEPEVAEPDPAAGKPEPDKVEIERPEVDARASAGPPDASAEKPSVLRTELPFGPFLAMAAVVYLFAEPWIEIHFRLPGW
jgi:leader peptidase (prepilin peptidase) / N-methyltransferase